MLPFVYQGVSPARMYELLSSALLRIVLAESAALFFAVIIASQVNYAISQARGRHYATVLCGELTSPHCPQAKIT